MTRTDKHLTPQGYVAAIDLVNAGYTHEFSSEWTGLLTVSALFDGQRYERYAITPTFTQTYQRSVRGRVLYVGFVHSFGRIKKDTPAGFEYDQPG